MISPISLIDRRRSRPSVGFTLIELMITLALTLILMYMFALIFGITGDFVSRQKGIADNDQAARTLTTMISTDLQARTMRLLAPYHPNMSALPNDTTQLGYFYISENNPADDTDDVLQFTVALNGTQFTTTTTNPAGNGQLFGHGTFLPLPWQPTTAYAPGALVRPTSPATATGFVYKNDTGNTLTSGPNEPTWSVILGSTPGTSDGGGTWTTLLSPIDQPDGDDGVIVYDANGNRTLTPSATSANNTSAPNNTGASQYAEVCYFLRHGNLCRRVLLIRQPYDTTGYPTSQPYDTDAPAALLIPGLYPPYPVPSPPTAAISGNFWTDFDYSARFLPTIWQQNTVYVLNNVVMPTTANGHTYTCTAVTAPGLSGTTQPTWPTTAGQSVTDNNLTWTADASTVVNFLANTPPENSLNNISPGTYQIALPCNRFGFDQIYAAPAAGTQTINGTPREFALPYSKTSGIQNSPPFVFFGRYTEEETSNFNYQFPGNLPTIQGSQVSPMGSGSILGLDTTNSTMWLLNANPTTGNQLSFAGGSRRGEDILLTNVISFDVKIWDGHYSENATTGDVNRNGVIDSGAAFADIGHAAATGDFIWSQNVFPVYGPYVTSNLTFNYTATPSANSAKYQMWATNTGTGTFADFELRR